MGTVEERLQLLHPTISEILATSGAPALSLGVIYQGKTVYTAHFGNLDPSHLSEPNNETIYRIASLTKIITACAIAILVEEGKFSWDTLIKEILPEFNERKDEIGQKATLIDILSHRTGFPQANAFWAQQNGECLMPKHEVVRTCCFMEPTKPFRKGFTYSNWNYGLATEVIERVSGMTYGTFVRQRFFEPLRMERTTLDIPTGDNIAPAYAVSLSGTPFKCINPVISDHTCLAGGSAGKSTPADLLIFFQALILAYGHQTRTGSSSTPKSPFKQLATVFTPHIAVGRAAINEQAYCLGLYKTRTPGNLGVASLNNLYLGSKKMPSIGASSPGTNIYHHTANIPGSTASAFLIPSLESVIVVFTNCLGLIDPTDFVGQSIISTLLGDTATVDYVGVSKAARQISVASYDVLIAYFEKHKTNNPPRHPLLAYGGEYVSRAGNFALQVTPRKDSLSLKVKGSQHVTYDLIPYGGETFYWPADHDDEVCNRSRFPDLWPHIRKYTFCTGNDGVVDRILWRFELGAKPEVFWKIKGSGQEQGLYKL